MQDMSIWHWLLVIAWVIAVVVPAARILNRLGYSGWWAAIAPIAPLNVIGLWVLAFGRWPRET
jgi:hypothetical protein